MKINKAALNFLLDEKNNLKKGNIINYEELMLQNYFQSQSNLKISDARQIFKLRSESLDVARNFSYKYDNSDCKISDQCKGEDSQVHYFHCSFVNNKVHNTENISYFEIFKNNLNNQLYVMKTIMHSYEQRKM